MSFVGENRWKPTDLGVTPKDMPTEKNTKIGGAKVKPIFHQNAKYLASGTFASGNAKSSTFALADARNTNMLVSFALGDANFLRWPCTFHVYFMLFVHYFPRWLREN